MAAASRSITSVIRPSPRLTGYDATCLAMVPAVAQALQRLTAAAMAYLSRPGRRQDQLPTMHDNRADSAASAHTSAASAHIHEWAPTACAAGGPKVSAR